MIPHYLKIDHNTGFQTGNAVIVGSQLNNPILSFVFTNNIEPHNSYGIIGNGTGSGLPTITAHFAAPPVTANILEALPNGIPPSRYPPGNFFPAGWPSVQFVNFNGGNYRLQTTSPYHNAGTDSKDVGGDISAVTSATLGVAP